MGKNLLTYPYTTPSGTDNGVTFTINEDGSIILNGTSTGTVNIFFKPINAFMLPAGRYRMSNGNPDAKGYMLVGAEQSEWTGQITGNIEFEKTVYGTTGYCLYQIPKGNTFNNVTIYPSLECIMTTSEMLVEVAEGAQKVYEAGRKSQYDEFWDAFQQNGSRKYYPYAFSFGWNDTNFKPKHPLANLSQVTYMFFNSEITDVNVDVGINGIRADAVFSQCKQLQTIKKLIVDERTVFTTNTFQQCEVLENIVIQGVIASDINIQYSPLSKNSITNVINALSTTASGKTLTLSKTAVNTAFETTEGAGDGEASTAWISLEQSRSNWTISLV